MGRLGRGLIKALREATSEGKGTWALYKDEPFWSRVSKVLYTCDILDPVFDAYYSFDTFIANCKRLVEYAPLVWKHRNWDYGFIIRFQIKLYENLHKGVYKEGHHVFSKSEERKLLTVIELLKRLEKDDYVSWSSDYLTKKYGEDDFYFKRIPGTEKRPGGPYSTMGSTREDRLDIKRKEAYNKDRKRLWKLEELQEKQDMELLQKYIVKYSKKWWD
jgi:hypothetical protein